MRHYAVYQSRLAMAYEFVGWYRNMVMSGQIEVSRYAIERMPYSDYELEQELRRGLNQGSDSSVVNINVYLRSCAKCRAPFRTFRRDQTLCLSCGDFCEHGLPPYEHCAKCGPNSKQSAL